MASALSRLLEQIIYSTGIDPCHEPGGLDLSLHITDLPGREAITVTWRPSPTEAGGPSSGPALMP